jgi:hypothetical protein
MFIGVCPNHEKIPTPFAILRWGVLCCARSKKRNRIQKARKKVHRLEFCGILSAKFGSQPSMIKGVASFSAV